VEHPGLPHPSEADHLALDELEDASVHGDERRRAEVHLAPFVTQLAQELGANLTTALHGVLPLDDGLVDRASIDELESTLADAPLHLLSYPTGRSLLGEALAAEPAGPLSQHIATLGDGAPDRALSATLEVMTASAYDSGRCTPALRHFRVALLRGFHPALRANALAALDPARRDLALELCQQHAKTDPLLDAFDQARAEADIDAAKLAPGPPRHFSWVHVLFALIIAGLTAYHYLFR
jgi:hypothetical protein